MDFNIDRGSMLKLCHERILDYALRREGQREMIADITLAPTAIAYK